jgi:uncharacterized protein (DUF885 family)
MLKQLGLVAAFVATLGLGACNQEAAKAKKAQAASAELTAVLDELSTALLREGPESATSLAVSEAQAGGPFQNRLSDLSRAALERQAGMTKEFAARLNQIDASALTGQEKLSYEIVSTTLRYADDGNRFGYGNSGIVGAPTPYVVNQLAGAYASVPDFLASQHPLKTPADVTAYLQRLEAFTTQLDQETARIGEDAAKGVIPPRFVLERTLELLRPIAATPAPATTLVKALEGKLGGVDGMSPVEKADAVRKAIALVRDGVQPAQRRQIDALALLGPKSVSDAGVWRLPDGEVYYKAALQAWTTTDMTPDEIHQMGLDLNKSISAEMDALLKSLGKTEGTVAERVQALSKEKAQLYPNTAAGRDQMLKDLNQQMAIVAAKLPDYFGALPKASVEVKRVPPEIEQGSPGGYYQPPALDGSRPGAYYINLRNTAEWPRFTLPTLTYHEASPGHHFQIAVSQEAAGLPFIRSALLWFSGYGEGWAVYAEQLADEMGMYSSDPAGRLGYLQSLAFRAARLVVDTGMHHKKWTREQAIDYMVSVTGDQPSAVATEVERYAVWPGQACAYMPGRVIIHRLRENAKTELGERFDLKAFHDQVLTFGPMPLSTLEGHIEAWVAAQKKG